MTPSDDHLLMSALMALCAVSFAIGSAGSAYDGVRFVPELTALAALVCAVLAVRNFRVFYKALRRSR
jgi:hypothetical protein